jgi:hypothetical protein
VYAGDFTVKLPVVAAAGEHTVEGSLKYQACDNAACYPPKTLPVKVDCSTSTASGKVYRVVSVRRAR